MFGKPQPSPWWVAAGLIGVVAGVLMVTSAVTSAGFGLRADDLGDLPALARSSARHYQGLDEQRRDLQQQVRSLSAGNLTGSARVAARLTAAEEQAGLRPLSGPGISVTLDDAPNHRIAGAVELGLPASDLLVHQQDIQAVVNALWAGGARGVTVQGQRLVSTTGVKCVGNTVVLQGVPYAPPYVIQPVGEPQVLEASVYADPYVTLYLQLLPKGLQFEEHRVSLIDMPAYTGSTELHYARVP
jgi:uncharacterized protein YlxW (UPF0749 family)